jgi:hypothetical protein
VLALLAVIIGGAATIALDQLWLSAWASSGKAFPVGRRALVELPAGESLVYYESPVAAPRQDVTLRLFDENDDYVPLRSPGKDISYSLLFTGWTGRALWKVNVPKAGPYGVLCLNHNYEFDSDIPADDRVVFLKNPNSLDEVKFVRTVIQITGATIVGVLVIVFYLLHGVALAKRRAQLNRATPPAHSRRR